MKMKPYEITINMNNIFKECYFVGDTDSDGLSANLNQLKFIKANYGYGQKQDWSEVTIFNSIDQFNEILKLI